MLTMSNVVDTVVCVPMHVIFHNGIYLKFKNNKNGYLTQYILSLHNTTVFSNCFYYF